MVIVHCLLDGGIVVGDSVDHGVAADVGEVGEEVDEEAGQHDGESQALGEGLCAALAGQSENTTMKTMVRKHIYNNKKYGHKTHLLQALGEGLPAALAGQSENTTTKNMVIKTHLLQALGEGLPAALAGQSENTTTKNMVRKTHLSQALGEGLCALKIQQQKLWSEKYIHCRQYIRRVSVCQSDQSENTTKTYDQKTHLLLAIYTGSETPYFLLYMHFTAHFLVSYYGKPKHILEYTF